MLPDVSKITAFKWITYKWRVTNLVSYRCLKLTLLGMCVYLFQWCGSLPLPPVLFLLLRPARTPPVKSWLGISPVNKSCYLKIVFLDDGVLNAVWARHYVVFTAMESGECSLSDAAFFVWTGSHSLPDSYAGAILLGCDIEHRRFHPCFFFFFAFCRTTLQLRVTSKIAPNH